MKYLSHKYSWLYIILITIGIYTIFIFLYARIDITSNKRYSFTSATHRLLDNLGEKVHIQILLSGAVKADDKRLSNTIKEYIQEYRALSNGKITFEFVDPFSKSLNESERNQMLDSLLKLGLRPYTLQAQAKSASEIKQALIIPGLIIKVGDRSKAINLFQGLQIGNEERLFQEAGLLIEYHISSAIDELTATQRKRIEYLIGHEEPLDIRMVDFFSILGNKYKVDTLNLSNQYMVPTGTDVLIIFNPYSPFTDNEKLKIDQFIMNGGKVLFVINTMQIDNSQQTSSGNILFINQDVNLDDMMFRYGLRLNYSLIKDLQCATISVVVGDVGNKPQIKSLEWPYYPVLNTNPNHVITRGLDPLLGKYATFLDTIAVKDVQKIVLASTSSQTQLMPAPVMVSINEASLLDSRFYEKQFLPVAVLLQGSFPSLYYNRLREQDRETLEKLTQQYLLPKSLPTSIIVVANPGMFINEVSQKQIVPMGFAKDMNYMFANQSFLSNMIEYLVNPNGLIVARNKNSKIYLLDKEKVDKEKLFWQFVNIILPIILLIGIGVFFGYMRRKNA